MCGHDYPGAMSGCCGGGEGHPHRHHGMDAHGCCGGGGGPYGWHHGPADGGCYGQGHEGGPAGARPFRRRFVSKEERIAWLESYLAQLQAEVKAVEERLAEMKAENQATV